MIAFRRFSIVAGVLLTAGCAIAGAGDVYTLPVNVTSDLTYTNTPMVPEIDFGAVIADHALPGVLDPNSIRVVNASTGKEVPCAVTEDFAYGDKGRVEWQIADPARREFLVQFRTAESRPPLHPASYTPKIGVGDLLRYNAREPRPFTLPYISRLVDLTGDGKRDLVGCWNYAYRPGWPWDGAICYPGVGEETDLTFGDLVRVRYVTEVEPNTFNHFRHIYMMADFADLNGDGRIDLVYSPRGGDKLHLYLNTGRRDPGGMPVFVESTTIPRPANAWSPIHVVDLNRDGAMDLVACAVYGEGSKNKNAAFYLRNTNPDGWPFQPADPVDLNVEKGPCFFDVDVDGALDAVCFRETGASNTQHERVVWQRNLSGDPPKFGAPKEVEGIPPLFPANLAAVNDGPNTGLLVTGGYYEAVEFYRHDGGARFSSLGTATSKSAVMSLSDQAWPCMCDWDGDGDTDLLVGGGYGWPRIVINEGTNERPAYAKAQPILSDGQPIHIIRNDVLGEPHHWHNMGYSYPNYVDWDADGLPDLIMPNETNRIFWYKNVGTRAKPVFGPRRQLMVDGYPDSAELRQLSAERALKDTYPLEEERPFWWRTGPAIADWNGDGLTDIATHDGAVRKLTLFTQYRADDGALRLKKSEPMKMADGRLIDDVIVERSAHWTESFRACDWDQDGLLDLIYGCAGTDPAKGSIYLLRNVGTKSEPVFDAPRTFTCFGKPVHVTNHGPHPWAGDFDGDGLPDLLTCVEWSVYPFYTHAALETADRPTYEVGALRAP
ncbi:MAG: VCBS repeat-containing protein [bacterium]|nr:VCBS repeat-containing protein [bacterium]